MSRLWNYGNEQPSVIVPASGHCYNSLLYQLIVLAINSRCTSVQHSKSSGVLWRSLAMAIAALILSFFISLSSYKHAQRSRSWDIGRRYHGEIYANHASVLFGLGLSLTPRPLTVAPYTSLKLHSSFLKLFASVQRYVCIH